MKANAPAAPALPQPPITIHNRLYPRHPYRAAIEEIVRIALHGLPGPWDVSASPVGPAWFHVEVVAPDAAIWSMSVPIREGPRAEELAAVVRAACVRHSRRTRTADELGCEPVDSLAGHRDDASNPGSARTGESTPPAPPAKGVPK